MRNDRVRDPAPARPGLAVQDAGAAGSRDRTAAASVECAASARTLEAKADGGGPTALCLALSPVSVGVERSHDYPTGDRYSVASDGLPTVLALEVALSWWSAKDTSGDPPPDPGHQPGEPALGCAAHPWRTAEARDRGRAVDSRQIHGKKRARAGADLEDLSPQPCGRHCRHGLPGRADGRLQVALRVGHPQAPTAAVDITHGDDQSNGRVDRPSDHRR